MGLRHNLITVKKAKITVRSEENYTSRAIAGIIGRIWSLVSTFLLKKRRGVAPKRVDEEVYSVIAISGWLCATLAKAARKLVVYGLGQIACDYEKFCEHFLNLLAPIVGTWKSALALIQSTVENGLN